MYLCYLINSRRASQNGIEQPINKNFSYFTVLKHHLLLSLILQPKMVSSNARETPSINRSKGLGLGPGCPEGPGVTSPIKQVQTALCTLFRLHPSQHHRSTPQFSYSYRPSIIDPQLPEPSTPPISLLTTTSIFLQPSIPPHPPQSTSHPPPKLHRHP